MHGPFKIGFDDVSDDGTARYLRFYMPLLNAPDVTARHPTDCGIGTGVHTFAGYYTGTEIYLVVDGIEGPRVAAVDADLASQTNLVIGNDDCCGRYDRWFGGWMNQVALCPLPEGYEMFYDVVFVAGSDCGLTELSICWDMTSEGCKAEARAACEADSSCLGANVCTSFPTCDGSGYYLFSDMSCARASISPNSDWDIVYMASHVTCDESLTANTNAARLLSGTAGPNRPIGSEVVYGCDDGFSGSLTFICDFTGFITSDTCVENDCTVTGLSAPSNGAFGCLDGSTLASGASCNVMCDTGFVPFGTPPSCFAGTFNTGSISCGFEVPDTFVDPSLCLSGSGACSSQTAEGCKGEALAACANDPACEGVMVCANFPVCLWSYFFTFSSLTCASVEAERNTDWIFFGKTSFVVCNGATIVHTNAPTLVSGDEGPRQPYGSQVVYAK
jgi:hypothetical protein